MFAVIFRRDFNTQNDFVKIVGGLPDVKTAKEYRKVSGDLVVYEKTNRVVPSFRWMWDWEVKDPNCYAQRALRAG